MATYSIARRSRPVKRQERVGFDRAISNPYAPNLRKQEYIQGVDGRGLRAPPFYARLVASLGQSRLINKEWWRSFHGFGLRKRFFINPNLSTVAPRLVIVIGKWFPSARQGFANIVQVLAGERNSQSLPFLDSPVGGFNQVGSRNPERELVVS